MMILKTKKQIISGLLAFSLLTSSWGGAFAVSAYAATPESQNTAQEVKDDASNNGLVAGLVAVGLLAVLTHHGGSNKNTASSNKSTIQSSNSGSSSTSSSSTSTTTSGTASSSEEQQAVSLLNKDRAANGLPALKVNSQLTKLAENYAKDMIARGYFSHYNPEGQSPFDRMQAAGISYKTAGENLAINTSVTAAETAFMNSPGHRANILNSSYTDVGIGVVHSSNGSVYVVQEFIGK